MGLTVILTCVTTMIKPDVLNIISGFCYGFWCASYIKFTWVFV